MALLDRVLSLLETSRGQSAVRGFFIAYVLLIFTLTHWPALTVPIPIKRPDILAHVVVFSTWCILATLCGLNGRVLSARNILWSWILAIAYASVDEGLQYPAFVKRAADWDDFWANMLGVTVGALIMVGVAWATGMGKKQRGKDQAIEREMNQEKRA